MAADLLASAGPWGLLVLTVSAVLTALIRGALVSGSSVNRLVGAYERQAAEATRREQDWRAAFEKSELRADLQAEQLSRLMTYAQATDQILRSLPGGAIA